VFYCDPRKTPIANSVRGVGGSGFKLEFGFMQASHRGVSIKNVAKAVVGQFEIYGY
jgi:hypothetical protein